MTDNRETVADLADRERTSDPTEVYENVEVLPTWWREVVHEFQTHDLRPYSPSRFTDDMIVREVITDLEERYGVDITLSAKNPSYNGEWSVSVDGVPITDVKHQRKPDGYTVYHISSDEFEEIVRTEIRSRD